MIDSSVVYKATQLKKKMDAAYIVFKKNPTIENSTTWTAATRVFNNYCVSVISGLIEDETSGKHEDILNNPAKYQYCKKCNAEILRLVDANNYIASIDFVEDFPGWCYNCLVEYCTTHDCAACDITSSYASCPFAEIKNLHLQEN